MNDYYIFKLLELIIVLAFIIVLYMMGVRI